MVAGNETTANLLSNFLNLMALNPAIYAKLTSDHTFVNGAIEETLRFDSPVQFMLREAVEDTQLGDTTIERGEIVQIVMAAANHDAEIYDHPETFDLHRPRIHHHGFGAGMHSCIGAQLRGFHNLWLEFELNVEQ